MRYEIVDLTASGGLFARGESIAAAISAQGRIVGHVQEGWEPARAFVTEAGAPAQDLGDLPGFAEHRDLRAWAINASGVVVGAAANEHAQQRAFRWTERDGMRDLDTLGGTSAVATAINDAGQIVGSSDVAPTDVDHAFLWSESAGMRDLGTLSGQYSGAAAIDNAGRIGGHSAVTDHHNPVHAWLWSEERGMTDIYSALAPNSYVVALGAGGHVVVRGSVREWGDGVLKLRADAWPEVEWDPDWNPFVPEMILYSLAGEPAAQDNVKPVAVNASGHVVGQGKTAQGEYHACLWPAAQQPIDLGTLPEGAMSFAQGINDRGDVVGWSTDSARKMRAVLWRPA